MRRKQPWSVDKEKFIQLMAERGAGSSAEYLYNSVMKMHKLRKRYEDVIYHLTEVSHLSWSLAVQLIDR